MLFAVLAGDTVELRFVEASAKTADALGGFQKSHPL